MKIFDFSNYKIWLLKTLRSSEAGTNGVRQSSLASALGCKPAYISKVLNEKNHFSLEHAEKMANFFSFSPTEKDYLIALVGEQRATSRGVKDFWIKKRQEAYAEYLELYNRTELVQHLNEKHMLVYYSNWHHTAIHAAVSIPELQTAEKLAQYFQISLTQTQSCLDFLCSAKLVLKVGDKYQITHTHMHLDKNSPLLNIHHLNWKHKAIECMQNRKKEDLNYLSVMTLSRKDYDQLRDIFLQAIEKSRNTIEKSKDEIMACYAIDLFELNRLSDLEVPKSQN